LLVESGESLGDEQDTRGFGTVWKTTHSVKVPRLGGEHPLESRHDDCRVTSGACNKVDGSLREDGNVSDTSISDNGCEIGVLVVYSNSPEWEQNLQGAPASGMTPVIKGGPATFTRISVARGCI